jgi:long-chain acyl-CoA synthetase
MPAHSGTQQLARVIGYASPQTMNEHSDTLAALLEGLRSRGDKPAVVQAHSDRVWHLTYDTLATDVARYADGLTAAGLTGGDRVLMFAAGGPDWITAFLAVIATGAVAVPLDTQTDADTLRHTLDDSGARWAITDDARQAQLDEAGFTGKVLRIDDTQSGDSWRDVKAAADGGPDVDFEPDATAILFYTSGTTGPPKGVPLSHRNLAFQLRAVVEAGLVDDDDVVLQPLPAHHVYPLVVGTLAPLALGLTIVIPEAMLGPAIVRAIQAGDVTFIVGVPRLYDALITAIESRIAEAPAPARLYLRNAYRLTVDSARSSRCWRPAARRSARKRHSRSRRSAGRLPRAMA